MAKEMSEALRFVDALETDSSLQAQFSVASPNSFDGVVDFASSKGYVFSKPELEAALKQYPESPVVRQLRQYVH